ncbi:MAG TPA: NUDIX hydrolase [Ktedonobacterales bacterium]
MSKHQGHHAKEPTAKEPTAKEPTAHERDAVPQGGERSSQSTGQSGTGQSGTGQSGAGQSMARFRIAVSALIERDGQYLLAHRSDIPWWNLPGGGLEYGETLDEGLAREIREEIGAVIEIVRLVGVYSKPQKREVVFTFLCHLAPDSPPPGPSAEVSRVAWFLPHEVPANLLPKHRVRLHDALRGQAEAIVRAQTTPTTQDQGLDPSGRQRPGVDVDSEGADRNTSEQ